jgi:hypothetical protein
MKGAEMLDTQGLLTVKQYSDYRKVSRQTVYKYLRNGKLSDSVYKIDNQTMIDPGAADMELSQNLDQIHNPPGSRAKKSDHASRLQIQNQAIDIATEGEKPGMVIPWPLWAAKYITALDALAPDRIKIELNSDEGREQWRVTVDEINTETERAAPWAVDLTFDLHPDQEG